MAKATQAHVEIETKYDVAEGQALPDLIGVGGVDAMVAQAEMVLTATYYDTPGLTLARARTTLRRRTGGSDDGWHLKLSLADGDRLELRRALGRGSTPPAALSDLLRALLRSEPLEAVATLVNRRTTHQLLGDGRVLAELADDTVTGERHDVSAPPVTWRELEVELVEGDRSVLGAVDGAVRAGGVAPAAGPSKLARVLELPGDGGAERFRRRTPVGEVLAAGVRSATRELLAADPFVRLDRTGAVARYSAALRTLAATVALTGRLLPDSVPASIDDHLHRLEPRVARLESTEVTRERVRNAIAREPAELVLGPVVRRVDRELATERRAALAALREWLDGADYLALLDVLAALPVSIAAAPGAERRVRDVLPPRVARDVRRGLRALRDLQRDNTSPAEREQRRSHALRAVARTRVAETLAAQTKGWGRIGLPDALTEASADLVELQHSHATQAWLRELGLRAQEAGESAFTFGRLHGLEDLAAAERVRALGKVAKRIERLDQE